MKNKKNTTLSVYLPKSNIRKMIEKSKMIPITHKHMTARFPGLVQALQLNMARLI